MPPPLSLSRYAALGLRRPQLIHAAARTHTHTRPSQWIRHSSSAGPPRRSASRYLVLLAVTLGSAGATVWAYQTYSPLQHPPGPPPIEQAEIVYEKPRKRAASKEENRALVSPQHVQVKNSWEHPGVYAWGSNAGRVVAPDSHEPVVKSPRRIAYFDDQILRDLKLDRDFGAAVTEKGDLVQWGIAFSRNVAGPTVTLRGKDIAKIAVSRDRIIALSSGGSVYSLPVAAADQTLEEEPAAKSSWLPFWSASPVLPAGCRSLKPENLGWGERVVDVKSGLEHCLLLTSKGRVFSAAASAEEFPSKGQLGVPGFTWQTRPAGPYDQPHEVKALSGAKVKEIAAGAFHSLALDSKGRVFAFGDNSTGQLGMEPEKGTAPQLDTPTALPVAKLYTGTGYVPKVTSIAAGGLNSFFTVDAARAAASEAGQDPVVAETWVCGSGIHGELGTGKWTHISARPTKIKALSGLAEYDEKTKRMTPIRLAGIAVGSTHACAVLDNATRTTSTRASASASDTNFGADALWWGGNEYFQLGTGRRSNANVPVHIGPLDGGVGAGGLPAEDSRMQITPRTKVRLGEGGKGRSVSVEQRVECGRFVTAVYSGA
ncbi:regulator of chromosome condensation 1/beta-lactamase-inhibitor protein II [Staphylotrichum tortipilum]|uniref:Regulator of chromosome condensation 1/beta-lactamase-inhibitor protein II n=1 Tax=Staphylotrichum tortipilum TaxID=2831512 RepID=A0AAN6MHQ2_9PEZI|nr:regulator of chromosome condensation 1/beta-lactamase-inhibitor protein II [Staphylotrichum longicolle]